MSKFRLLHIGLDDTDSKDGMCTTYVGAVVVDRFREMGVKIFDYPRLIRLNPNWVLKTRGNCAISIEVETRAELIPKIKQIVFETVEQLAELDHETTNPGVAFLEGGDIPEELKTYSKKVIQDIVTIDEAENLAKRIGAEVFKFKIGRGIVGALAAIGEELKQDKTYELVAYRVPNNRGTKRKIDRESVFKMNELTYPSTFDNIDLATGEIRITPHTPCPILYGIRAENPQTAVKAHNIVKALEPIERWVIYKTNQATDEHIRDARISKVQAERSFVVRGEVCKKPRIIRGGHVIFRIRDESGGIDCAAYEPTRKFRETVMKLTVGDVIKAYGGVKQKPSLPLTINLEKIEVIKLSPVLEKVNPVCSLCGKRMKSAGKRKGFMCKHCKLKLPKEAVRFEEMPRLITLGVYEVPPRARRHLAKPLIRLSPQVW
ncbi:MAG: tRNA(Ile)(2)-agmatinylcytidine synthase [Candidatus Methylarchaceae archaeon HK02M1]|nr:tRNA(Ile)(2)-agmatinylcytidine synthase [Candidatus Methylarchaceae archaeon HK02M1]